MAPFGARCLLLMGMGRGNRTQAVRYTKTVKTWPRPVASAAPIAAAAVAPGAPVVAVAAADDGNDAKSEEASKEEEGTVVTAPTVGTYYAAAGPDKPPFVKPGQAVSKGDVLYIIEAMKVMNEIKSEMDGTVGKIFVKNGDPVEFGQPILTIV